MPDFIHKIFTHLELFCFCRQRELLQEMDRVLLLDSSSPQLLSYDTTFQLGDFYLSVLCFRHTIFKEAPVIPAAFLTHERTFEYNHKEFFRICKKLVRSLDITLCPIVTDEEQAIVNAITEVLPQISRL